MAITKAEIQVQWSAANSVSIAAGASSVSDAFTFDAASFKGDVQFKADNNGTPAAGDTVDFYLLPTLGDPDGASDDEYASNGHGIFLGRIDTNTEDPGVLVVGGLPAPKGGKIRGVNNSAGRAITVSACLYEYKA